MAASAQGIRAGRAYVQLGTDDTALERGLKTAEARLKAWGESIAKIGAGLAGLGAAITTPLLGAAKSFADAGSALNDMSERTGISVEALSALSFAAKQTGTDLETLEGGVRKMQKALVAGSEENLQAASTFAALGLSVDSLMKLAPEKQFERIARAIAGIHNPTAKAGAAMQVFGKSGTALVPLINDLDALTGQAKELGLIMSTKDARAADALGDAMDTVSAVAGRTTQVIGAALAPTLTEAAELVTRVAKRSLDWADANRPLIATVFKAGAAITAAGAGLVALGVTVSGVGSALGVAAAGIGGITTALGALLTPVALVTIGLGGLAAWFATSTDVGRQAMAALGASFASLYQTASQTFKGVADALSAGNIQLAAKVLWAGLRVEWLKGVNALQAMWADWGVAFVEVFRGATYQIAGLMTDLVALTKSQFAILSDQFTMPGNALANALKEAASYIPGLAKVIKGAGGNLGSSIDAGVKSAGLDVGQSDATKARLAQIEADRQAARAALGDQQTAETDARRKAAQDGLAGAAADLKAAQDSLSALTGQAGKEAAAPGLPTLKVPKLPDFSPDQLDQAFSKVKATVSGSFSASAFAGLGAGKSVGDETLKEAKKTNDQLAALNKKAAQGRLVFT